MASSRPLDHSTKTKGIQLLDKAQREADRLYEAIRRGKPKLVSPDGEIRLLPKSLNSFLVELTGPLLEGKCVYIFRNESTLTTVEAAAMLGVSRQFLVNLLESGKIPFHMVGSHRRMYAQDVLEYKAKRDTERRKILDDLVHAEVEDGLYDRIPPGQ
jgi:excisionase family DNA binding protein